MNITTVNFGVLLGSLGCINHDDAVLTRSTQPKIQPKEKPKKKILLALLFLCQIAFAQNYSLSFDGVDDYVYLGSDVSDINYTTTRSAWVKLNNYSNSEMHILNKFVANNEGGRSYILELNTDNKVTMNIMPKIPAEQSWVSVSP